MIKVRFFAMLRNLTGVEEKDYEIDGTVSLEELKEMVKRDFPKLAEPLEKRSVFISINQEFARKGDEVKDGDEVAFLPPFSGG